GKDAGWCARCVPRRLLERCRSVKSTPPDIGLVRRAGGRARCRQPTRRRNAPASAAATAQRKEAVAAEVQARGTGQLLPGRADLVARIIPLITSLNFTRSAPIPVKTSVTITRALLGFYQPTPPSSRRWPAQFRPANLPGRNGPPRP